MRLLNVYELGPALILEKLTFTDLANHFTFDPKTHILLMFLPSLSDNLCSFHQLLLKSFHISLILWLGADSHFDGISRRQYILLPPPSPSPSLSALALITILLSKMHLHLVLGTEWSDVLAPCA